MQIDTNILINSGIGLAILGYLGYLLKGIPEDIFFYVSKYITNSIQVTTDEIDAYKIMTRWIRINFPVLKKHIHFSGDEDVEEMISDGTYFCIKNKTICKIIKRRIENKLSIAMEITIVTVGLHGDDIIKSCGIYIKNNMPSLDDNIKLERLSMYYNEGTQYIQKKDFSTIFSPHTNRIKSILDNFVNSKEIYYHRGQVYKIGFLLYGEPGSGKSTMAKAIASYLGWSLIYIDDISRLSKTVIPQKSVLLFEDIDCLVTTRTDEDDVQNITNNKNIHILLNFLDGTLSPEDVIFVATTNYIEKIDSAILRPGRFDYQFYCGELNEYEAKQICKAWDIDPNKLDNIKFPATIAKIINHIMD